MWIATAKTFALGLIPLFLAGCEQRNGASQSYATQAELEALTQRYENLERQWNARTPDSILKLGDSGYSIVDRLSVSSLRS